MVLGLYSSTRIRCIKCVVLFLCFSLVSLPQVYDLWWNKTARNHEEGPFMWKMSIKWKKLINAMYSETWMKHLFVGTHFGVNMNVQMEKGNHKHQADGNHKLYTDLIRQWVQCKSIENIEHLEKKKDKSNRCWFLDLLKRGCCAMKNQLMKPKTSSFLSFHPQFHKRNNLWSQLCVFWISYETID